MADVDAGVASGQPKLRTFRNFSFRGVNLDIPTDELVKLFSAPARRSQGSAGFEVEADGFDQEAS